MSEGEGAPAVGAFGAGRQAGCAWGGAGHVEAAPAAAAEPAARGGEFPIEAEEPLAGERAREPDEEGEYEQRAHRERDAGRQAEGVAVVGEPHARDHHGAGREGSGQQGMREERGKDAPGGAGEGARIGAVTHDAERRAGVVGEDVAA